MHLFCLSGGMDSAACLLRLTEILPGPFAAVFFDYGQVAVKAEQVAAKKVWSLVQTARTDRAWSTFEVIKLPSETFGGASSLIGRVPINHYADVRQAVRETPHDKSLLALRNAIFASIAGNRLLALDPQGGFIIMGIRGRTNPNEPAGFPDCTHEFAHQMGLALSQGSRQYIKVWDFLNQHYPTRHDVLHMMIASPLGQEVLAHTVSCYSGIDCGQCLPCLRRAEAFERAGIADPASFKGALADDASDL